MTEIEKKINYEFQNPQLLQTAVTHSSYANEHRTSGICCNERLEFLGDSVLGIITAEYLYQHFSDLPEGELTKARAQLVCEKSLSTFAKSIHLGESLLLGKGELLAAGCNRDSILADAFEAMLAATYLDGGFEAAKHVLLPFIMNAVHDVVHGKSFIDYKTNLQEIVQKNKEETLEYVLKGESGPDHAKLFQVGVYVNSNCIGTGLGKNKKEAEQMAAKEALKLMGV